MSRLHGRAHGKGKPALVGILTWGYTWSDVLTAHATPHVQLQPLMFSNRAATLADEESALLFHTDNIASRDGRRTSPGGCGTGDNCWHCKTWCYESNWKMQVSAGLFNLSLYQDKQRQRVFLFAREELLPRQRSAQSWEGLSRFSLLGSGSRSRNLVKGVDTSSG